jgi:hypothetical protein
MNSLLIFTLLFFLAVVTVDVAGQSPTPSATSSPTLNAEAVLNHAIELTGQLDQRLLATVYWCLGTLVAVLVILVGYNWFTNFRAYQREGIALRQQIASDIATLSNQLKIQVQENLESLNKDLTQKATDSTKESRSQLRAFVQSELSSLKSEIGELQATALANERDDWLRKGVHSNALRAQMAYLQHVRKMDADWRFQQGLDMLESIFKGFRESNSPKPSASDLAEITAFLKKIENENPIVVGSIVAVMKEIRA